LKDIFLLGIPTFFRQVIGSVLMILVNNLLRYHGGTAAISVFGMTQRILMLFMMPLFGLTQGLAPIIGYNYGAKKFHRVYEVLRLAVKIVTGFGLLISLIYLIYPTFLVPLFTQSSQEVQASKLAVLLQMSSFFLIGFQITIGTYYQSVGQYKKAFILSFLRQAFVFIPLVVCFAWLWSLLGIWRSFPVTDVIAAVITIWICRKDWQNLRKLAHNSRAEVPLQGTIG
jgi:Na+-driven multidrug efflux pump